VLPPSTGDLTTEGEPALATQNSLTLASRIDIWHGGGCLPRVDGPELEQQTHRSASGSIGDTVGGALHMYHTSNKLESHRQSRDTVAGQRDRESLRENSFLGLTLTLH